MSNSVFKSWEEEFGGLTAVAPIKPERSVPAVNGEAIEDDFLSAARPAISKPDLKPVAVQPEVAKTSFAQISSHAVKPRPLPSLVELQEKIEISETTIQAAALMKQPTSTRIRAEDKRVINGSTDVNQLVPFKYKWAWEKYLAGCANHWMPQEIGMSKDIEQWKNNQITEKEKRLVQWVLGFFSTADSLAANNIVLGTYRQITAPECRQFLLRQAFEEAIHTHAYQYIIESLGIDPEATFNAYNEVESIRNKDQFLMPYIECLTDPAFKTGTFENDQKLLKSLIVFACIMEGTYFYSGFANVLALGRANKLPGTAEQFQYILRDESMHSNFGIDLINTIKHENPHLWTPEFKEDIRQTLMKAVDLEADFIIDALPEPILEIKSHEMLEYTKFITQRRSRQIGCGDVYPEAQNPFPWMSEMMDLKKETNFFERRVTEYQTGGLNWE